MLEASGYVHLGKHVQHLDLAFVTVTKHRAEITLICKRSIDTAVNVSDYRRMLQIYVSASGTLYEVFIEHFKWSRG